MKLNCKKLKIKNADGSYSYVEMLKGDKGDKGDTYDDTEIRSEIGELSESITDISRLDKRVKNLEASAEGKLYYEETSEHESYKNDITEAVLPYGLLDSIGGKSIILNQLANTSAASDDAIINNGDGSWTIKAGTYTQNRYRIIAWSDNAIIDHKYFLYCKNAEASKYGLRINASGTVYPSKYIFKWSAGNICVGIASGTTVESDIVITPMVIDLTSMFGSTIADSMTAEDCEKIFTDYISYTEPQLVSATSEEVVSLSGNVFSIEDAIITTRLNNNVTKTSTGISVAKTSTGSQERICLSMPCKVYGDYYYRITITKNENNILNSHGVFVTDEPWNANTSHSVYSHCIAKPSQYINIMFFTESAKTGTFEVSDICITADRIKGYTPYHLQTIDTKTLTDKYFPHGMRSAGDVCDELDIENGIAIQRVGAVDLGMLVWEKQILPNCVNFRASLGDIKLVANGTVANIVCARYNTVSASTNTSTVADKSVSARDVSAAGLRIQDTAYTTASEFKTAMSGVVLYYELAEPIITPITENIDSFRTLEVEQGGTVTFKSNLDSMGIHMPVPNKEEYLVKVGEV